MFHGADPTGAQALAHRLLRISGAMNGLTDRLLTAESLAEYPTGSVGMIDDASLVLRSTAGAIETAAHELGTFRLPLSLQWHPLATRAGRSTNTGQVLEHPEIHQSETETGSDDDANAFAGDPEELLRPYWDQGLVWTGAHRPWIGLTRTSAADIERFDVWAEVNGWPQPEAYLELAQYKAMEDKGTNAAVASGRNPTRLEELEAQLRGVVVETRLRAAEEGWTADEIAIGDRAVVEYFADDPDAEAAGGYPAVAASIGYQLLAGKAALGIELPTLTDAELEWSVELAGDPDKRVTANTDILSLAAAISGNGNRELTVGLRALATSADALVLLQAISIGDTQVIREKTADIAAGAAIATAAKWLLPRVVGGPVTMLAMVIIALTQVGPPPGTRPPTPPSVGWTDELGRTRGNGPCLTAAGVPDRIACGG